MAGKKPLPEKICATCGRTMVWRAKWRSSWQQVRYCSKACQGGPKRRGRDIEQAICRLGLATTSSKTFCPSLAAMAVFGEQADWPVGAMEEVRSAARRLVDQGRLEVLQKNQVVDAAAARGPIRLRLTPAGRTLDAASDRSGRSKDS